MNIVMTGGHSGLGLELTRRLLKESTKVGLIVRSRSRLADVPSEVRDSAQLTVWEADLASRDALDEVAEAIRGAWSHVDVLFNNAGVLLGEFRTSAQGNEMHLEVNTLAPYRLTHRLKPLLDASDRPTVVNTVTGSMHRTTLDMAELTDAARFQKLFGAYLHSKVALTLLMNELSRDPEWRHIVIRHVNPGANRTGMTSGEGMPWWLVPLRPLLFSAPTKGATLLYQAAFDESHGRATGQYFDEKRVREVTQTLTEDDRTALMERLGALT